MNIMKEQKSITVIEHQILSLYAKGFSTKEIQDHLQSLYGIEATPALISKVSKKIKLMIKEWQDRPLKQIYAVMFIDAIYFKVKQDEQTANKVAYTVIGIDLDGNKDVLGIWISEKESTEFWLSVLSELKNRGVQDILIASVTNLTGFSEAINACYPDAEIQKCIVHQVRDSIRYAAHQDVKQVTEALKQIYTASSEDAGLEKLNQLEEFWGEKYPPIVQLWRNNWAEISTFFKYPSEIRKIICTNSMVQSYHQQLQQVTKRSDIFPTDEALLKTLIMATQDILQKCAGRVENWSQILFQLSIIYFPDKVKAHLR